VAIVILYTKFEIYLSAKYLVVTKFGWLIQRWKVYSTFLC